MLSQALAHGPCCTLAAAMRYRHVRRRLAPALSSICRSFSGCSVRTRLITSRPSPSVAAILSSPAIRLLMTLRLLLAEFGHPVKLVIGDELFMQERRGRLLTILPGVLPLFCLTLRALICGPSPRGVRTLRCPSGVLRLIWTHWRESSLEVNQSRFF